MFCKDKPRAKQNDTLGSTYQGKLSLTKPRFSFNFCEKRRTQSSRTEHTLAIPNFKIPSFEGKYDPDGYCDWKNRFDFMFNFYGNPEEDQVSLVTLIFKNYAAIWWQNICRNGETKIRTWAELKKVMRERFAPIHYLRNIRRMIEKRDHDAREGKEKVEIVSTYEHEVSKRHVTSPSFVLPKDEKENFYPKEQGEDFTLPSEEDKVDDHPKENTFEDAPHLKGTSDYLHISSTSSKQEESDIEPISQEDTFLQKTESKEAESEKSLINGPNLVSEKEHELKDFVEPLRGAQTNQSTYDKEAFSIHVDDRSLTFGSDSRANPFEEWGNDTCMGWVNLHILEKKLKLFDARNKAQINARIGGLKRCILDKKLKLFVKFGSQLT
ncbi:hypothetical protein GQ457_09G018040 [Hibiscus cannabinus]